VHDWLLLLLILLLLLLLAGLAVAAQDLQDTLLLAKLAAHCQRTASEAQLLLQQNCIFGHPASILLLALPLLLVKLQQHWSHLLLLLLAFVGAVLS
jgi:hypothetical protein